MKKFAVLTVLLAVLTTAQAQMQAVFAYSTFYAPGADMPYVETYLSFDAWTMQFKEQAGGTYRATAEVLTVLKQGDSVCYVKKYDLNSPAVDSLSKLDFSFLDVQRFSVKNGIYDLEITLRDKGSEYPESTVTEKLVVNYDKKHPAMSSLQMMSSIKPTEKENILSRGGYDMEPYVSDFFPEQVEQMHYYFEVYNIDKEVGSAPFLVTAYVEQQETGSRMESLQMSSRKKSAALVPVYGSLDISQLPSGNYNLVVELRNKAGEKMLYKKVSFFRSNPGVKDVDVSDFATTFAGRYTDEDQLNMYIDALYPLSSSSERSTAKELIRRPGLEEKQAFLYRFWQVRYPMSAEAEWLKYKERVDHVQAVFSYPKTQGIHTDRGRVYLQYGPPDFIRDEKNYVSVNKMVSTFKGSTETLQTRGTLNGDDMTNPGQGHIYYLPYQLWRYNKLSSDDADRVFLFWDEHRSGFYTLLVSNARGEVQDPMWERRLCRQQIGENVVGEVGEQFNRGY
jgi:GWxTD domain-containing protein